MRPLRAFVLAAALGAASAAHAQSSTEDRLREALRKTVVDLRAAQDSQVALQAALDQAKSQRDALQQQVDRQAAEAAEHPAEPAPAPATAAAAAPPPDDAKFRAAIDALKRQNAELEAGLRKWQAAYQNAASVAQAKDAESHQAQAALAGTQSTLGVCEVKNTRLIAVANDILHLYRTQGFRSLLVASYEPLLGFKKVELENIVQDNEDKVRGQRYYPNERPAQAPAPAATAAGRTPRP